MNHQRYDTLIDPIRSCDLERRGSYHRKHAITIAKICDDVVNKISRNHNNLKIFSIDTEF